MVHQNTEEPDSFLQSYGWIIILLAVFGLFIYTGRYMISNENLQDWHEKKYWPYFYKAKNVGLNKDLLKLYNTRKNQEFKFDE